LRDIKLGYVRSVRTIVDQRYVDEDIFFSQNSRKAMLGARLL
jgi:hypothetical protein